jgi:hypothetical protein
MRLRAQFCPVLGSILAAAALAFPQDRRTEITATPERLPGPCNWIRTDKGEVQTPIVRAKSSGAILVCIQVNGKAAEVILDTGSNVTILSREISQYDQPDLTQATDTPRKGSGWVGTGRWGEANIRLGDRDWINRRIVVEDVSDISRALNHKVEGILGEDILRQFKYITIDYDRKFIIFGS